MLYVFYATVGSSKDSYFIVLQQSQQKKIKYRNTFGVIFLGYNQRIRHMLEEADKNLCALETFGGIPEWKCGMYQEKSD